MPPNILWICTDQQRFDTLGCTGNPHVRTPHIDALARRGVLFENAFCQNPLCTPSRGSFLTGRYPSTNRLRQNGQNAPADLLTLPKILRDSAGYVNGLSGKLHLSACDNRLLLGRDWWRHSEDAWYRGSEPRIDDGYHVFHWDHSASFKNPTSAFAQWVWQKAGHHPERLPREDCPHVSHGLPEELHQTTFCVEKAIDFLQLSARKPHPWLFSVNIFDPHPHFDPPDAYLERYLPILDELPLPVHLHDEHDTKPVYQKRKYLAGKGKYAASQRDLRFVKAAYYAMVDLIDAQVGRLLQALEDSRQTANTLVIFSSDHGELLGDHGVWPKGPFLYDCSVRVPLILSMPGTILTDRRAQGLIELTDLAPTLLEACGLPVHPGMQGRSVWPQLTGQAPLDTLRDDVLCEYHNSNPDASGRNGAIYLTMIRTRTHKLVNCHGTGEGELYDLANDPSELHNRWDDPQYASIKVDLLTRLSDRMAFTVDPLPPRVGVF